MSWQRIFGFGLQSSPDSLREESYCSRPIRLDQGFVHYFFLGYRLQKMVWTDVAEDVGTKFFLDRPLQFFFLRLRCIPPTNILAVHTTSFPDNELKPSEKVSESVLV